MASFDYPEVHREDLVEKIFDVDVPDPYRWLEDPKSEKTKEFVRKQNDLSRPYIEQCQYRDKIRNLLLENQNYEKVGCPFKRGGKYFQFINSGLQAQSVLYQQETLDGKPKVFFDPNTLSEDGTVALSICAFSPDGKYFAYGISRSGSDWLEIYVRDVETGKDLKDKVLKAKFTSINWTHDNKGFFYAQFPSHRGEAEGTETESHENHSIYYHVLNTDQCEDQLKVNRPDLPKWNLGAEVSEDGKFLFVQPREGCDGSTLYYCELDDFKVEGKLNLKPLYTKLGVEFDYIGNDGKTVYFKTNANANNYRIVKFSLDKPEEENWIDVVPNHPEDVLDWAELFTVDGHDYLLINYLRKVVYYLELRDLDGKLIKKFNLSLGTISKASSRRNDEEFFFHFTSFITPGCIYHFDLKRIDSDVKLLRKTQPRNFNSDDYTIQQIFYSSKDKTQVPMFIIHHKSLERDGSNPCIIYGYGGFNIMLTSSFNVNRLAWLKNFKGILAVPNLRGGGELGKNWHDSGRLFNKQNVFDDFIAAAEYLIDNKYTSSQRIAIEGGSNGGLLVAAVSNQRPELFRAQICHVGVLDMLRYSKFTIGHSWISDFGDPDEKDSFLNLLKYSPYHNIPDTDRYPATLLLTGDHDDRVVPAHSLKFIAQLQHKLGSKVNTPLLARIDTKSGHGGGRPLTKVVDQYTDIYSFICRALGLENYFKSD